MVNKLLRIIVLCLVLFQGSLIAVYAQGPDEEEEPLVIAPSGQLELTFEQLGYDIVQLNRGMSVRTYWIRIPGNFQISPTGNYFDLVTGHLPPIPDKPSVLGVRLNGHLLYNFSLGADNAESNTVRIELPEDVFQIGRNWIRLDLDTSATCEDPGAIVDVIVDNTSTLSFGYEQISYPADLSLYPFPFVEGSLLEIPVTIVLPDLPTSDDLSAAATIAAGLGQMSGGDIDLTAVLANDLSPDVQRNHHLIPIGKPDSNALLNDLKLPLPIDTTTLKPGQGALQEIVSPWNEFRLILVVSGLDDEGVLKAGTALNRQAHFLGMRGPIAIVLELGPLSKSDVPSVASFTLASLGYDDEIAYGAQPHEYTFDFTLPLGWRSEEPPSFVLSFAHASILDPEESVIDVTLNNVPLGSALLDSSNATEGELTVSLPEHRLKTGRNRLEVGVEMNLLDGDKCNDLADTRAWTVISSESEIFLPYSALNLPPDLGILPYPFSQSSGLDQTLFVLPDHPDSSIVNDLIRLAAYLGSAVGNEYLTTGVAYASEVDEIDRNSRHFVLIGRPSENVLLREINPYLPQPFIPDGDILEPLAVDNVTFLPDPEREAGLLELAVSPWNENYSLLAVTGTTDEGVELAVQTLLGRPKDLKGNLAVVEPVLDPFADEPNQVSTYSIDTRPPAPTDEEASANNTMSDNDRALLAERWWK